jgi:2-succinyl-6-hydroxy-2,4-cyclohexadiene-1-carboxylate synthase
MAIDVPLRATFVATAGAIGDIGGRAIYVGYSMGGRLCLRLALDRPDLVHALVLVSASPGIADAAERARRVASDEVLAREVERDGVDTFLTRWLAQPMFVGVRPDAPGVRERAGLTVPFIATCLRVLGAGAMEPMWERLDQLAMPAALVTGTRDTKYDAIAIEMIERMRTGVLHLRLEGGHALPQEQPTQLAEFVSVFAAEHS